MYDLDFVQMLMFYFNFEMFYGITSHIFSVIPQDFIFVGMEKPLNSI